VPDEPTAAADGPGRPPTDGWEEGEPARRHRAPELERVVVFTDAVVAIALTLLVLDLRLPDGDYLTDASLQEALRGLSRNYIAFGVSFVVISVWWWTNHRMLRKVYRYDGGLLALDLVWLATIVFLPFPTSVLSNTSGLPTATAFYACANAAVGLANLAMLVYLRRRDLVEPPMTPATFRVRLSVAVIFPAVFLLSVPIAYLVGPSEAQYSWFLAAIVPWVVIRVERHLWGPG
jgi:uncharacterized membrane protein